MPFDTAQPPTLTHRIRSALDPVSRATELLFGLIMVLTFTASLNAAEAGQVGVRLMLIAALGCTLAWGLIDAAMYLIAARGEQALATRQIDRIRGADTPEALRVAMSEALPAALAQALGADDLKRIQAHLSAMPRSAVPAQLAPSDYLAALLVFLLVFIGTLPVVLPFFFLDDPKIALPLSHAIAITLLFLTGWGLGRHWDRPWRVGLTMVAVGLVLVAIALALGG